jgi:hypothetical protein
LISLRQPDTQGTSKKTTDMQEIEKDFYRIGGDFRRSLAIANAAKQEPTS